jgi:hypothetical protein
VFYTASVGFRSRARIAALALLALELTVLSPSDRWMMEVNGTTPATVVARIRSVDWGASSTSFLVRLEVEEISSRFR